jgi:hypothetical protein
MVDGPVKSTHIIPPKRGRRIWKAIALLLIFLAGAGTGIAVTIFVAVHRLEYAVHHPENVPPRLTKYLKRHLDLNPSQAVKVEAILTDRQASLGNIRRQVDPQIQHQLQLLRAQIAGVLNDSQKLKWFEIYDRAHVRWVPDMADVPSASQPSTRDE